MKSKSLFWAYASVMFAMTVWASSFILTRIGLESFQPVTLVTMRMSLAVLLLFLVAKMSGKLQRIERRHIPLFVAGGFAEPFCYFICEAYGLTMVSPTVASVIMSTIPLFSPLLAYIMIRERVSWFNIIGIVISLVGVLMLVVEREQVVVEPLGIILLFGAVASAIVYAVFLRKIPTTYNNVSVVFYIHLISLFFFIPTFFIVDFPIIGESVFQWRSFIAILVLAIFASVISFVLFSSVVRKIGVTRANAFCNVMPGITALLMYLLYGEVLPLIKIIGIVIVIIGLFISQMQLRKHR